MAAELRSASPVSSVEHPHVFFREEQNRKLIIYLPARLPGRANVGSLIRRHGGVCESRLAKADIVVIDTETYASSKQSRDEFRAAQSLPSPLPCVGRNWVTDSIKAGVVQNPRSSTYDPIMQLDELEAKEKRARQYQDLQDRRQAEMMRQEAAKNPALAQLHKQVKLSGGVTRYTAVDAHNVLEQFMVTKNTFGGRKVCNELVAKYGRHTVESYLSWIRSNMDQGYNLRTLLRKYKTDGKNPVKIPARLKVGDEFIGNSITPTEPPKPVAATRDGARSDGEGFESGEEDPIINSTGRRRTQASPARAPRNPSLAFHPHGTVDHVADDVREARQRYAQSREREAAQVREESRPADEQPHRQPTAGPAADAPQYPPFTDEEKRAIQLAFWEALDTLEESGRLDDLDDSDISKLLQSEMDFLTGLLRSRIRALENGREFDDVYEHILKNWQTYVQCGIVELNSGVPAEETEGTLDGEVSEGPNGSARGENQPLHPVGDMLDHALAAYAEEFEDEEENLGSAKNHSQVQAEEGEVEDALLANGPPDDDQRAAHHNAKADLRRQMQEHGSLSADIDPRAPSPSELANQRTDGGANVLDVTGAEFPRESTPVQGTANADDEAFDTPSRAGGAQQEQSEVMVNLQQLNRAAVKKKFGDKITRDGQPMMPSSTRRSEPVTSPRHRERSPAQMPAMPAAAEFAAASAVDEDAPIAIVPSKARVNAGTPRVASHQHIPFHDFSFEDEGDETTGDRNRPHPLRESKVSGRAHRESEQPVPEREASRTPRSQVPQAIDHSRSRSALRHGSHFGNESVAGPSRLRTPSNTVHHEQSDLTNHRRHPSGGNTSRELDMSRVSASNVGNVSSLDRELAKSQYMTAILTLCKDFGFHQVAQLKPFLAPYGGDARKARMKLERHFDGLASEYGQDRETVIDFVREAQGKLPEAERFLRILSKSRQRSGSTSMSALHASERMSTGRHSGVDLRAGRSSNVSRPPDSGYRGGSRMSSSRAEREPTHRHHHHRRVSGMDEDLPEREVGYPEGARWTEERMSRGYTLASDSPDDGDEERSAFAHHPYDDLDDEAEDDNGVEYHSRKVPPGAMARKATRARFARDFV
ncbi:unnamed protein product [Jaminaea pallidilutea]